MVIDDSSHEVHTSNLSLSSSYTSDCDGDDEDENDPIDLLNELNSQCTLYHTQMVEAQKKCVESDKEISFLRAQVEELKHSQRELKGQLLATQFKISSMETLAKENDSLKNEVEELRESISKFHKGKENLDTLLVSQRTPFLRYGLGFNEASTSNGQRITFVKSSSPPQTSGVDVIKTKGRKPKSKQGGKTPSVTLIKKKNTSQGQTPKKHHTQK